jgi:hypothetical protein
MRIQTIEKKSQSDFGYFNHESRTEKTDKALIEAAQSLNLAHKDVLLWCDSTYARHFMDGNKAKPYDFVKALNSQLPKLRAEVG